MTGHVSGMRGLKIINPWGKQEITLTHLRRAWSDLRQREEPARLSLRDLDFERCVRTLGCSACDDDRHWVYLVRAGQLVSSVVIEQREIAAIAAQRLDRLGLDRKSVV